MPAQIAIHAHKSKLEGQALAHPNSILVLGGARSGKSRHAQMLAQQLAPERSFIATAQAFDTEMKDRIQRHRDDRDSSWQTVEAPLHLAAALAREQAPGRVLLVDCLTLWLSNLMLAGADIDAGTDALLHAIRLSRSPLVLVSNEVGFGIVPENALARRFRDAAGRLNQQVATTCAAVDLVVAGLPLRLKG